jgi:hypothetical protein
MNARRIFVTTALLSAIGATAVTSAAAFRRQSALFCSAVLNGAAVVQKGVYHNPTSTTGFLVCPIHDDARLRASNSWASVFGWDQASDGQFGVQACSTNWPDSTGAVCGNQWTSGISYVGWLDRVNGGSTVDTSAWANFPANFAYLFVLIPPSDNSIWERCNPSGPGCNPFYGYVISDS